jgi:hypothetical protein
MHPDEVIDWYMVFSPFVKKVVGLNSSYISFLNTTKKKKT